MSAKKVLSSATKPIRAYPQFILSFGTISASVWDSQVFYSSFRHFLQQANYCVFLHTSDFVFEYRLQKEVSSFRYIVQAVYRSLQFADSAVYTIVVANLGIC